MNSNEFREHIRQLNEQEAVQHELRRQEAIRKIQEIRRKYREQENNNELHLSK